MPPSQVQSQPYQGPIFNPKNGPEDYFWYATSPAGISSVAANAQSQIQFDADSQFLWIATSYQANIGGALVEESTNVIPLVNLQMQDGGSGKYLSNAPLPLGAIAGDGKRPYRLIGPRVWQPNSTLNINWSAVSNLVAGSTYSITLVLHGLKLYS